MSKKAHLFKRPNKNDAPVRVIENILPSTSSNLEVPQKPLYIVIHEVSLGTGKSPSTYNMEHYANMIKAAGQRGSTIGYHYLVGDKFIYHFIPDDISTSHTGTAFGNRNSIGIERIICEGTDYEHAIHNQAKLTATLMLKHNIPLCNVITHKQMQYLYGTDEQKKNPKQCPGRLLAGFRGTMTDFKSEIERCFMYGWFFEELLDEHQIAQIPDLMQIARQKHQQRINEKKAKRLISLNDYKSLENYTSKNNDDLEK